MPHLAARPIRLRPLLLLAAATLLIRTSAASASASHGAAARAAAAAAPATCLLQRVVDGDTIVCADGTRVRLLLIDTPEMDQGPYGRRARDYLVRLVPMGTPLRMVHDVVRRDRYGRTLAYLFTPDGRMINEEMARAGYAVLSVYPPNVRHVDRIAAAVEEAQETRAGLWETPAFECSPADHRADRCG